MALKIATPAGVLKGSWDVLVLSDTPDPLTALLSSLRRRSMEPAEPTLSS